MRRSTGRHRLLVTLDNVEDARWKSCFLQPFGHEQGGRRIALRGLQDKTIAAGQGNREHPHRHHGREIERRDSDHDTERLAQRVRINPRADVLGDLALEDMTGATCYSSSASKVRGCWCRRRRLHLAYASGCTSRSNVSVSREAPRSRTILNVFPARIKACFSLGASEITLVLALGTGGSGTDILARITRYSFDRLGLRDGMDVFAQLWHVSVVSASEAPPQAPEASVPRGTSGGASLAA